MAGTHAYWLSPFKYLMMKWFDNTFKGTSSQHKDKKAPNSPVCGRAGQLQVAPPAGCWHPPEGGEDKIDRAGVSSHDCYCGNNIPIILLPGPKITCREQY